MITRLLLVAVLSLTLAPHAWADCTRQAALATEVDKAIAAYSSDTPPMRVFLEQTSAALTSVRCLEEPITAATAARLHLLVALRAFVERDPANMAPTSEVMTQAFEGFLHARPDGNLPADTPPLPASVRAALERAHQAPSQDVMSLEIHPDVTLRIDGWIESYHSFAGAQHAVTLKTRRAAILQVESPHGPTHSWYLGGDGQVPDELREALRLGPPTADDPASPWSTPTQHEVGTEVAPVWPAERVSAPSPLVPPLCAGWRRTRGDRERRSRPALCAGVALAAASGVALTVSWMEAHQVEPSETPGEAEAHFVANQAFGWGGYGLGAIAIGLGGWAAITGSW